MLALVLYRATGAHIHRRSALAAVLALALGGGAALLPVGPGLRSALFLAALVAGYGLLGVLPPGERALLARALRRPRP